MSYIDKEKALEFVLNNTPHINGETTMECVERAIKEIPAADVVEVVRCKDCKHYCLSDFRKPNDPRWCEIHEDGYFYPEPNYYCADGERGEQ